MNWLAPFIAWRRRRKLAQALERAERERRAVMRFKDSRREKHQAFRYLDGDLRRATNASLQASVGLEG